MTERERFILSHIAYDHDSGVLTWKKKPNRNIPLGRTIGRPNAWGHLKFSIQGRTLMVHRVAWFLHYGEWPKEQIDHINGNQADNRIVNLRDVSQAVNMQNKRKANAQSKSKLLGAHYQYPGQKKPWGSSIKAYNKRFHLGSFATAEEAHHAYLSAKERLHAKAE